jgi:hypothetical protein
LRNEDRGEEDISKNEIMKMEQKKKKKLMVMMQKWKKMKQMKYERIINVYI